MKRGDLITVAMSGDWGKSRPALIVQSDDLDESDSVLVCLLTTTLRETPQYRLDIEANTLTKLERPSQIQIDKIMAVRREKCGPPFGQVPTSKMSELDTRLVTMLGIGEHL